MNFGPSKQVVKNLFGSIRDVLNCIGKLFHSTLTDWNVEAHLEAQKNKMHDHISHSYKT
jgi:hypothetical protein